jgi:hypothetical protein
MHITTSFAIKVSSASATGVQFMGVDLDGTAKAFLLRVKTADDAQRVVDAATAEVASM